MGIPYIMIKDGQIVRDNIVDKGLIIDLDKDHV